jgi:mannose-6-phosphate isomerase
LACVNFAQGTIEPVAPVTEWTQPTARERLFDCSHFRVWRLQGAVPFTVGAVDEPRVLVCLEGIGHVEHDGADYAIGKGATLLLLPACVGACRFRPKGAVTLLEIAMPDQP